eukprot:GILJ01014449.1.p1 GENE.GILJ01014449.1~~GILJ01014449.1.p1  ORF type:complete len:1073 (+),score=252.19 GILJ01014449.1:50-3220(+)
MAESNGNGREVASAGIIDKIHLENFMCHRNFDMEFNPNVNFIVGQNGSGKSTILVALCACLGAKASFTGRGTSAKELIKHGAASALVQVYIKNHLPDAYKHKEYGNKIIVERRINRDGSGQYKLKNAEGKVIDSSRKELELMMEHFNIQAQNPCAIMTQDASKQFLHSGKDEDKYKFFMQATQLEEMKQEIDRITQQQERLDNTLKEKEAEVPELERRCEESQQKYDQAVNAEKMMEKVELLRVQRDWAAVEEKEREAEEAETIVKREEKKRDKELREKQKLAEEVEKMSKVREEKEQIMNENNALYESFGEEGRAINQAVIDMKRKINKIESEMKQVTQSMNRAKRQRDETKKRIINVRQTAAQEQQSTSVDVARVTAEIDSKRNQLNELQDRANSLKATLEELQNEEAHLKQMSASRISERNHLSSQRKAKSEEIRRLNSQRSNSLAVYGDDVVKTVQLIEKNANRFARKPLGPVGNFIKVKDPRYKAVVETALTSGFLRSFHVDSHRDAETLKGLCRSAGLHIPSIFIQRFRDTVYPLNGSRLPAPEYTTLLSLIEVTETSVMNLCIDQRNIEGRVIVDTLKEGSDLANSSRYRNMAEVHTMEGHRYTVRQGTVMSFWDQLDSRLLGADVQNLIHANEEDLHRIEQELAHLQPDCENSERRLKEIGSNLNRVQSQTRSTNNDMNRLSSELRLLERDLTETQVSSQAAPADTTDMENDVEGYEKEIEAYEKQGEDLNRILNLVRDELVPAEERKEQFESMTQEKMAQGEQVSRELTKVVNRLNDLSRALATKNRGCQEAEARVGAAQKEFDLKLKEIQEFEQTMTKRHGNRPENRIDRSAHEINEEMNAIQRALERERQQRGGTVEELYAKWQNESNRVQRHKNRIENLRTMHSKIDYEQRRRLKKWLAFRKHIAKTAKLHFNRYMNMKGYAGILHFDFDRQKISIEVNMEAGVVGLKQTNNVTDTKTLSGGERSFTTLSFVLALGESMDVPFRAMDEFDVFMDSVNRRLSLNLLVKTAKEARHRQFIFITPQDITNVQAETYVSVVQMHPPRD